MLSWLRVWARRSAHVAVPAWHILTGILRGLRAVRGGLGLKRKRRRIVRRMPGRRLGRGWQHGLRCVQRGHLCLSEWCMRGLRRGLRVWGRH